MDRTYPEMPKLESTALILVDVLSSYEHDDAAPLKDSVEERLPQMEALVHEDWTQDRHTIMAGLKDSPNARLVDPLAPADDVPFITKGRHSIFWETPLAYLLQRSGIEHLVLIGQVTEQCILYSALDGYIRHFEITIPRDACATIDQEMEEAALRMMERNMHARITDAAHAFDL
jgi:nicotinamidase-related amidase